MTYDDRLYAIVASPLRSFFFLPHMPSDCPATDASADVLNELAAPERSASFYFTSGQRELKATGLGEAIAIAAIGGDGAQSALQRAVADGFERARNAGQDKPVIVGAIPFSTTAPSCLYIPAHHQWRKKHPAPAPGPLPALVSRTLSPQIQEFKSSVLRAMAAFNDEGLSKVVLSVMQELQFEQALDAHEIFRNLCAQNRNAYQFLVPLTDGRVWLGASPELLVSKQGDYIVSNPLAGSARRMDEPQADQYNADQLALSAKDRHEHALVPRKIAAKLAPLCAQLHVPERPSLTKTETLWHLSTRIEGRLHDPAITALQLACLLHPTPAVCGFPTEPARQLIADIEPFERGFYSGMVGWCDADGNGEWAVALRCGEVRHNLVRLFAGAGIVDTSKPQAEWAEIHTKFGTMLRALEIA